MQLSDFNTQFCHIPYENRLAKVKRIVEYINSDKVQVAILSTF